MKYQEEKCGYHCDISEGPTLLIKTGGTHFNVLIIVKYISYEMWQSCYVNALFNMTYDELHK